MDIEDLMATLKQGEDDGRCRVRVLVGEAAVDVRAETEVEEADAAIVEPEADMVDEMEDENGNSELDYGEEQQFGAELPEEEPGIFKAPE